MRRAVLPVLGMLGMFFLLPSVHAAETAWRAWDNGLAQAGSAGRPVLVDVYTDWCGWCKRMDRDVYSRRDVQEYLSRRFVTVKLNAESSDGARYEGRTYTSRSLAARFGVNGYPTTIFLSAKGTHLGNVPGYIPADRFLLLLRYIGDGHAEKGESFEDFARAQAEGARR
jgi:thioredoxin-related protein